MKLFPKYRVPEQFADKKRVLKFYWKDRVLNQGAGLVKHGAVGVVDVPAAVRCGLLECAVDLEAAGNQPDVVFQLHGQAQSLSG